MKSRHDNSMLNPAWFVEKVEIEDLTADRQFLFHCERWLAKNKEDKKIERNFYEKDYKVNNYVYYSWVSCELIIGVN